MPRPQRVRGVDASFLALETANQPIQVFTVMELDPSTFPGGYSFERMREMLAEHARAIPALRERLSGNRWDLDHPSWVADDDFDITRHVRRIALRSALDRAELTTLCGRLGALPLDRRHPLWEMWVIEGAGGGAGTAQLAVLLKLHHAAADGVTFVKLLGPLWTAQPVAPQIVPVPAAPDTGHLREVVDGLGRLARRPLRLVATVLPAVIAAVVDAVSRVIGGRSMATPFTAPRTILNAPFTAGRNLAFTHLDLREVKRVKDHFGVKVNDVVAALVGGVVRQFLLDRGELPDTSLVALEPVSVHGLSDSSARNQVSGMFVRLRTDLADPVERVRAVAEANRIAKEQVAAIRPTLLEDLGETVGPVLLGIAKRVYGLLTRFRPMYNVILSNFPGPDPGRYFLGCEVTALHPVGPILLGAGINFTVTTVNGRINIGLTSCPDLVPDLAVLADGLPAGLSELLLEIDGGPTASAVG